MTRSEIWLLYRHELRGALRERSIVVNSILMPIFLYPVMLWAMFSGMALVEGLSEGASSRVAVYGLPAEHAEIRDSLAAMENVELVAEAPADPGAAETALRDGNLDAVAVFEPASGDAAALPGNFVARVTYDQAEDRSRVAQRRVSGVVDDYRARWLERESEALAIPEEALTPFEVERSNIASSDEMGAFLLSLMVPLFLVIMVAVGCFYPAIDATAGERERSTWETLMTVSASRSSVLGAKYLYVATMGIMAGLLNVVAIFVTIGPIVRPLMGNGSTNFDFAIPLGSLPVMALGAIGLALLFAALMMIMAAFARTFKDGQAMIMPVYYLALLPVFFVMEPDIKLDATTAAIPVANVVLMIREALQGGYQWVYIGETLVMVLAMVGLSLGLSRWVLASEDVVVGSYEGSFWKFIKERVTRRGAASAAGS